MLGSVVVLGPSILPVFEQLGMLEDLEKYSLPFNSVTIYNEKPDGKLKHMGGLGMKDEEEISGHRSLTFLRQRLYEALLSRISPENISLGKKLLKVVERDDRIIMYCSDRSAFIGDILVGADGAYSAVRQNAYKAMKREGVLPKTDAEDLLAGYTCMIGITDPVNPEKYPQVKEGHANGETVLGRDSKSWSIYVTEENRIYWSVKIQYKSMDEAKRQMFMTSEWAPGLDHAMVKEFQDRPCPYGGTLGDLFNMTRKETAVKVYLEHKMFETWFYRRSVLIGDACHKMLPSAGQGAVNALQDAVILANCLYELKNIRQPNVTAAFQSYYDQRYQHAKAQYYNSELAAKLTIGLSWSDKIARMTSNRFHPTGPL
ncbi:hypothetical protein BGZ83_005509 [Gryganskiella cystojenkinii]|nr:hypothetical protein BGZ83_005509 [Gryganskiella cystojenkinii]